MEDRLMKLLPCPFCGGKAEIERLGIGRASIIVICIECGCCLGGPETFDHWKQWNTRATDPLVEEMARALENLCNVWESTCSSYGWDKNHLIQYTEAEQALQEYLEAHEQKPAG